MTRVPPAERSPQLSSETRPPPRPPSISKLSSPPFPLRAEGGLSAQFQRTKRDRENKS